jgi:hypothetical protein
MNMTFPLIFKGLECYEHGYCIGNACQNVANNTKQCSKEDSRCWVYIYKAFLFFNIISNLFLENNFSGGHKTWLWYVFHNLKKK